MKLAKKLLAVALCVAMLFAFTSCGNSDKGDSESKIKVGVILVGDSSEGYTLAHINGIKEAAKTLGLADDQIVWKYKVEESSACYDAADELALQGCKVVFANSYGHQTFLAQAAKDHPDVTFVSMTGDFAAISGLSNLKNAFTDVYESRFVSGVVAGLKLKEITENGTLTAAKQPKSYDKDGNIKIGYVGAFNYAEVISGYTAFYLGIKSVFDKVVMEVIYTQSWFDIEKEAAAAEALMDKGCVIIGQHADSTGAPSAVEAALKKGTIAYSVGYNIDMLDVAPTAALTSATNNWGVYYTEALKAAIDGEEIPTNWAKGYADKAVAITALGASVAPGTKEKVEEVEKAIVDGTLKVFDTSTFTADKEKNAASFVTIETDKDGHVTSAPVDLSYYDYSGSAPKLVYQGETKEAIVDGAYSESTLRSAPYFTIRINGITED